MDVISIPKMNVSYRVLYDHKGRFVFVKLKEKEAQWKLCRIQKKAVGANKVVYLVTHDGRTLRFADPSIEVNDTIKFNLKTNEVMESFKMKTGNVVFVMNGNNRGRVGVVQHINKFAGNNDLITIRDSEGHTFTTRVAYVIVVGKGSKPVITLPRDQGLRGNIIDDQLKRMKVDQ